MHSYTHTHKTKKKKKQVNYICTLAELHLKSNLKAMNNKKAHVVLKQKLHFKLDTLYEQTNLNNLDPYRSHFAGTKATKITFTVKGNVLINSHDTGL